MHIRNNHISAQFNLKGAELISLKDTHTNQEYIWQADSAFWGRHAPVLFPIVGRLKDDTYTYQGKSYKMSQHGFARDLDFQIETYTDISVVFLLHSNDSTRTIYPFDFELRISYRLDVKSIITKYEVKNIGSGEMLFSIGAHPAFCCPMQPGEQRSDYKLIFNKLGYLDSYQLTNGYLTDEFVSLENKKEIAITDSLFDKDALVFKQLTATNVSLASGDKTWLKFHYQGFPYLGIWSKNQTSPFVCIEPWFGVADHDTHDGRLENKEGIQKLDSQAKFTCDYKVDLY
jgi:galactose mutarotase-like enzyme